MLFHTVTHKILTDKLKELHLIPIGDTHVGDPGFDDTLFMETVRQIKEDENALCVLTGDMINNALKDSVSNVYDAMRPSDEIRYFVKLMEPIKDKLIGVLNGNHCIRTDKHSDISPAEVIAAKLNTPYFGDEVFLKISFGQTVPHHNQVYYGIFAYHGAGGGRLAGSKVNVVQRMTQVVLADIYIAGHTHQISAVPQTIYVPDLRTNKVNEQKMMCVSTGSYLKRDGYPAQKGLPPMALGSPTIIMSGKRKDVKVII